MSISTRAIAITALAVALIALTVVLLRDDNDDEALPADDECAELASTPQDSLSADQMERSFACFARDAEDAPECSIMLAAGRPTDDVLADLERTACVDDGSVQIIGSATYDCQDGRKLTYNDWGIGVAGGEWQEALPEGFTFDDIARACGDSVTTST